MSPDPSECPQLGGKRTDALRCPNERRSRLRARAERTLLQLLSCCSRGRGVPGTSRTREAQSEGPASTARLPGGLGKDGDNRQLGSSRQAPLLLSMTRQCPQLGVSGPAALARFLPVHFWAGQRDSGQFGSMLAVHQLAKEARLGSDQEDRRLATRTFLRLTTADPTHLLVGLSTHRQAR